MATSSAPKQGKVGKSPDKPKIEVHISNPLLLDPDSWSILQTESLDLPAAQRMLEESRSRLRYVVGPSGETVFVLQAHAKSKPPSVQVRRGTPGYDLGALSSVLIRSVIEKTLESAKEVQRHQAGALTPTEFIRQVGEALADKADAGTESTSTEEEWQRLLEQGLRSKISLLKSKEFKSTAEASHLLGIGEHAVRKRIKDRRLFALRMPGDGEHRIPAWALDSKVTGATTASLLAGWEGFDEWRVYHFMSNPNGDLNGLRPFECLLSEENLPPPKLAARTELASYRRLAARASLLDLVKQSMKADLEEGQTT